MATSLQQQLAAIAQKSTHQLDLKAQRSQHSQSLLFEPKEAANQTFDTIYQIALDGFEELCLLDSRFTQFAQNIFSEQSKNEDRTQMTAKENEELDQVIQSFLGLVCGRLLLRPAQLAVEWLVRRFRVHEDSTEHFVLAFLPYHDTSIFPTVLSLLPKNRKLPPSLKFLQPYITSLAAVPRHAVLYTAINNPTFFTSLNAFVLKTAKQRNQSAALLGFWASIMAQAINGQLENTQSGRPEIRRQREEDVLLRILPVLQAALDIKDLPELYLGCCMITVILATNLDLEEQVLDGLMDAIAGSWTSQTVDDGIASLCVLASVKALPALPKITAQKSLAISQVSQKLQDLSAKCPADRFYTALAISYVKGRRPKTPVEHHSLLSHYFASTFTSDASKAAVADAMCRSILAEPNPEDSRANDIFQSALTLTSSVEFKRAVSRVAKDGSLDVTLLEKRLDSSVLLLDAPANGGDVDSEGDTQMDTAPGAASTQDLPLLLDDMVADLEGRNSVLDDSSKDAFPNLARTFAGFVESRLELGQFAAHKTFAEGNATEDVLLLSFLMRTWTSHPTAPIRQNALSLAKQVISGPDFKSLDLQALLPYCLLALADSQQSVRRAASELVLQISKIYNKSEKAGNISDLVAYGKNSLYGQNTRSIKWMKPADVQSVLSEVLVDSLEEFLVDPSAVSSTLVAAIDGTDDDIELKTSTRSSLYTYLISHAAATPLLNARVRLLSLLASIGKTSSAGRKQILLPAIKTWISSPDSERSQLCNSQSVTLSEIDRAYIESISAESEDEFDLLRSVLIGTLQCSAKIRDLALFRFISLWPQLQIRQQTHFAQEMLNAALSSNDEDSASSDYSGDSQALIRQVKLSGDTLVALLTDIHSLASMPDGTPASKRRRTSTSKSRGQEINPDDLDKVVRRLTFILELVESSKPERHPELLKHLFHVLGDIQQIRSQLGSDLVYLQQMTIGSLLGMVDTLKATPASKMDRSALRADLVVDCMRSTSNSQVHNAALLLISSMASWAPDLVLHSVMPIFTFMSNTILRQGDDYSAHIIDQTVSHVIPPLVSSLRKKNQDLVTGAAELLLSFIAAFEHMPMHRRLQLFKQLVKALGPEEALSAIIAMLFERYSSDRRVPDFCAQLSIQFDPAVQLKAVIQYLDLVADALQPKRTVSEAIFSFEDSSPESIRDSAASLLISLARFLREEPLVLQIRKAMDKGEEEGAAVRLVAGQLIDRSIGLSRTVENDGTLVAASEAVISAVFDLPPLVHFVKATAPLLEDPEEGLGSRVLESLESRAMAAKASDSRARQVLLDVLPDISAIVEQSESDKVKLFAISCLDKISEKFGKKAASTVLDAAKILSSDAILGHNNTAIQITAVFSLSTMIEVLRDDMIGVLPGVIEKGVKCLRQSLSAQKSERLFNAVLTLFTTILDYLPWMISSKTMVVVIDASIEASADYDLSTSTKVTRDGFVALAAQKLEVQILVNAVAASIDKAYSSGVDGTEEVIAILDQIVTTSSKASITKQGAATLNVLKQLFDLRQGVASSADQDDEDYAEELDELDRARDAVMMKAIMKLNDAAFRPFFVQLVDWATEGVADSGSHRAISLFGFLTTFFSTLKSLVTSYATYVLGISHDQLLSLNANDETERRLISSILTAMSHNFQHDQDDFWQAPAHFSKMSAALIHQLKESRTIAKEDRVGIIPAIAELAAAASSADHLKELNQELLACMRSQKAHIRLAAIKCARELTDNLGEDWLALLPEMLPFISELQEDEDEGVEKETLAWIKGIEGVLGESLEGMLQ